MNKPIYVIFYHKTNIEVELSRKIYPSLEELVEDMPNLVKKYNTFIWTGSYDSFENTEKLHLDRIKAFWN